MMRKTMITDPVRDDDEIVIFDATDDLDFSREEIFSSRHNDRLERIFREKGKVTWGDVYAPVLAHRQKYMKKKEWGPELWSIFHTDPATEMVCVFDESDGTWNWVPEWEKFPEQSKEKTKECRLVSRIRNLFLALLFLFSFQTIRAQGFYDPEQPMIVPFAIGISTVNDFVHDTGHTPLPEDTGYVILPPTFYTHNGKSHGIIVSQGWDGTFFAFEARCPVCFYVKKDKNPGEIDPRQPFAECNKCGASADNLKTQGSPQMFRYKFNRTPIHMNVYTVRVIEKEKDTYLLIDNGPNGYHGEWKENPDNRIIVEGYQQLYGRNYGW